MTITLPRTSSALLTDRYTVTMAQSLWRHGQADEPASFELFVRRLPEHRLYLVSCGVETALAYLSEFHFSEEDLELLAADGGYEPGFLDYLARMRFSGDVHALHDGTVIPAQAPILRVSAPRAQAAIVESALLAMINHETMIASKAARVVAAAAGRDVWDFSLRRLHGLGAATGVARASYIAGCAGTASLGVGLQLGIPTSGTMAHHYVQSFGPDGEQAAFEQFLTDYPQAGVLLVDTYDTERGVERAIAAAQHTGIAPKAVRLDSGDLAELAKMARSKLDAAGLQQTGIFASNDLDEYSISALLAAEAPIDGFGVGTMLGTSADAPSLGGVYKLVAQEVRDERPTEVMKLAAGKQTDPGCHQLWHSDAGYLLGLADEQHPEAEELLKPRIRRGELVSTAPTIESSRARCAAWLGALDDRLLACHRDEAPAPEITLRRSAPLLELSARIRAAS